MKQKLLGTYINLFGLAIGIAMFGVGISFYKSYPTLFDTYQLHSVLSIIGFGLMIYIMLHYGRKVDEIIKKL